ncbi:MAG: NAD(+) synthase, partial [Chloroflexi bacterium]|nr:NAD(+) synthase [Chloroflexota bacterium]
GVESRLVDITGMTNPYFDRQPDISNHRRGNVMARMRMIVVYDHSEDFGGLVIGTSNKAEILLGYGTLFGDLASAVNPIGDLFKTQVRQMARAMNLPVSIIDKPPSADLWEGQSDEEDLGMSYDDVDRILYLMFDERFRLSELLEAGFPEEQVTKVYSMVRRNQFKRRPPIIAKISDRTIEREFRYPRDWGL